MEKDLRPIPSPHANHDVGAVADGRPAPNIPAFIATTTRFRGGGTRALRKRRRFGTEVALGSRRVRPDRRRAAGSRASTAARGTSRDSLARRRAARKPGGPASPCRRRLLVPNASRPAPLRGHRTLPPCGSRASRHWNVAAAPSQKMLPGNGSVPGPTTVPESQAMSLGERLRR